MKGFGKPCSVTPKPRRPNISPGRAPAFSRRRWMFSAAKARLAEIDVELSKLTTRFSEHVLDSTNAFELVIADPDKLSGLPPSAIAAAKQSAEAKGIAGW